MRSGFGVESSTFEAGSASPSSAYVSKDKVRMEQISVEDEKKLRQVETERW